MDEWKRVVKSVVRSGVSFIAGIRDYRQSDGFRRTIYSANRFVRICGILSLLI